MREWSPEYRGRQVAENGGKDQETRLPAAWDMCGTVPGPPHLSYIAWQVKWTTLRRAGMVGETVGFAYLGSNPLAEPRPPAGPSKGAPSRLGARHIRATAASCRGVAG